MGGFPDADLLTVRICFFAEKQPGQLELPGCLHAIIPRRAVAQMIKPIYTDRWVPALQRLAPFVRKTGRSAVC